MVCLRGNKQGIKNMSEIISASKFCTYINLDCPYHPTKHDKGCTPCIAANLKTNDIPRCFFEKLGRTGHDTSFQAFAEIILSLNSDRSE